jgi:hypothetical protein
MKTVKITFYSLTGLFGLLMIYSAFSYLTQPALRQTFEHLGYPGYFRIELAIAKLIGVGLLLAPVSRRLKELAFAGFAFTFISAFIAHSCVGDPMPYPIIPLIFLIILIVSYISYTKWQRLKAASK